MYISHAYVFYELQQIIANEDLDTCNTGID